MGGQVSDLGSPALQRIHKLPGFLEVWNYDSTKSRQVIWFEHSFEELNSLGIFDTPNIQLGRALLLLRHKGCCFLVGKVPHKQVGRVHRGVRTAHLIDFNVLVLRFDAMLVDWLYQRQFATLRVAQQQQVGVCLARCVKISFWDVVQKGLPDIRIASAIFLLAFYHLKIK